MRLKHDIGDTVYYYSSNHDAWLKGVITAAHTNTTEIDDFIMYTIKNLFPVDEEDEGGFVFDSYNVCGTPEEMYERLKEDARCEHAHKRIWGMDLKEFNKMFDETHGYEPKAWEIPEAMTQEIERYFKNLDTQSAKEKHSLQTRDPVIKEYT